MEEENQKQEGQEIDIARIKAQLVGMKDQIDGLLRLLQGSHTKLITRVQPEASVLETGERVLEGVFDGKAMIGDDGGEYHVVPNYASKSKIVEGDRLKLTITNNGTFLYKQIAPIERKQLVGELAMDADTGQWVVVVEGKPYKILTASVTFYKGKPGDQVAILVPTDIPATWGAVENVIH
jgi:hypothetical protein